MPAVEMFIAKFGRVVKIDHDHPLAIAQVEADTRAKSAAALQIENDIGTRKGDSIIDLDALRAMKSSEPVPVNEVLRDNGPTPDILGAVIDEDALRKIADPNAQFTVTPIPGASVTVIVPEGDSPALAGFMDATRAPGADGAPVASVTDHPAPEVTVDVPAVVPVAEG